MIRVALRFGMVTDEVTQSIEPREPRRPSESTAVMLIGVHEETVQKDLDAFNKSTVSIHPVYCAMRLTRDSITQGPAMFTSAS